MFCVCFYLKLIVLKNNQVPNYKKITHEDIAKDKFKNRIQLQTCPYYVLYIINLVLSPFLILLYRRLCDIHN